MQSPPLIVFSDLDGTLLDHETYAFAAARPALDRLAQRGVPLILASSKTAAEIERLREEIGCAAYPAIVENGAGLLEARPESSSGDYPSLRKAIDAVPPALRRHFTGFGDLDAQAISDLTGLPLPEAMRAARRQYSEPGLWNGTEAALEDFLALLADSGIRGRRGGRFLTLSFGATKSDRMAEISRRYGAPFSVALGDAPNDREMIAAADRGIIVANPCGAPMPEMQGEAEGRIIRTKEPGPAGWNIAMLGLLDQFDL